MIGGRRGTALAWVIGLTATGCASAPAPRVEGAGGGAAYWPASSRTAALGAIDAGLDAVAFGVALSSDDVPLLNPGATFNPERCTHADGRLLEDRVIVHAMTVRDIEDRVRCGGIPDPAFDQALVVSEAPMRLSALADHLHDAPGSLLVRLDVAGGEAAVGPLDAFAAALVDTWYAEDLPQELVVSSDREDLLLAVDTYGRSVGFDVPTALRLTSLLPGGTPAGEVLAVEADRIAGGLDYVARAELAQADGVWVGWDVLDPDLARAARAAGLTVGTGTIDDPVRLARVARQGLVDVVSTNYPGEAPAEESR